MLCHQFPNFALLFSGYLQCVTVVIPGSET